MKFLTSKSASNLIVIFLESYDPINYDSKEIYCWNKTDDIKLNPGIYFYRDVKTNFYNTYPAEDGSYFVGVPYELGDKYFYKIIGESNYCISCGVDMGAMNPRQYCCKTYCPNEND
jgi:hypothetical protein